PPSSPAPWQGPPPMSGWSTGRRGAAAGTCATLPPRLSFHPWSAGRWPEGKRWRAGAGRSRPRRRAPSTSFVVRARFPRAAAGHARRFAHGAGAGGARPRQQPNGARLVLGPPNPCPVVQRRCQLLGDGPFSDALGRLHGGERLDVDAVVAEGPGVRGAHSGPV